jgi:hypothetical protein
MRRFSRSALALSCCWLAGAHAQQRGEEPAPDLDFLEYLGAWAEDDEEWIAIQELEKDNAVDADKAKQEREERRREHEKGDEDESE